MTMLPVLTYHSIDDSGSVISVSPEAFRQQMEFLASRAFTVLSVAEALEHLRTNTPFPQRAVVITFDDGFQNNYVHAFPCLVQYGFPATIFAIAGRVGTDNDWLGQPGSIPRLPLLSWKEMEEMSRNGIEFGAHTISHRPLTLLPPSEADDEIRESQRLLEERLQKPIRYFAYPYGSVDSRLKQVVGSSFDAAFSTQLDLISKKSELTNLERVDVYYLRLQACYRLLAAPAAFCIYVMARNGARHLRASLSGGKPYISTDNRVVPVQQDTTEKEHRR